MKTNLDSLYKTNSSLEDSGIEMEVSKGVAFQVRRYGGKNAHRVSKAMAKYHKPFANKIATGNLSQEEIDRIDAQVFTEACVVGWSGVCDSEGKPLEFSFDACVEILSGMPDLLRALMINSTQFENYREEVGNS